MSLNLQSEVSVFSLSLTQMVTSVKYINKQGHHNTTSEKVCCNNKQCGELWCLCAHAWATVHRDGYTGDKTLFDC